MRGRFVQFGAGSSLLVACTDKPSGLRDLVQNADRNDEGSRWMRLADLYEQVINWPGQREIAVAMAFAASLAAAGILLSFWKPRWLGRFLGLGGLGLFMILFLVIREQTTIETSGEMITIKRYRYTESTRLLAFAAAMLAPCSAAGFMWIGHLKVRHQLRQQAPLRLKAGRKHFAEKNFDAALREYTDAIQATPELAEGYCRRGVVYHEMGKTEEALTDLDRAIECDPLLPKAYLERAKLRTESGDFDGALADFDQLMQIQAHDPDTYLQRGVCLVKKGLVKDGIADFYRVLKLTNHSDYAEPAKKYLRQALESLAVPPRFEPNGAVLIPSSPDTQAQDQPI